MRVKRSHIEEIDANVIYYKFDCDCGAKLAVHIGDIEPLNYQMTICRKCLCAWDINRIGANITVELREKVVK